MKTELLKRKRAQLIEQSKRLAKRYTVETVPLRAYLSINYKMYLVNQLDKKGEKS